MAKPAPTLRGGRSFSRDERAFLAANWQTMSAAQMAAHLGRTASSVEQYRQKIGLHHQSHSATKALGAIPSKPRGYTEEQHRWALLTSKLRLATLQHKLEAGLILCIIADPAARGLS